MIMYGKLIFCSVSHSMMCTVNLLPLDVIRLGNRFPMKNPHLQVAAMALWGRTDPVAALIVMRVN